MNITWLRFGIHLAPKPNTDADRQRSTLKTSDGGSGAVIHDKVRESMREILRGQGQIQFLDPVGQSLLKEARDNYVRLGLDTEWIRQVGNHTQVLLWKGDRINDTLLLMMIARGFKGMNEGLCLSFDGSAVSDIESALKIIANSEPIEGCLLARSVQNKIREKWDMMLPESLLEENFASTYLNTSGVARVLVEKFR